MGGLCVSLSLCVCACVCRSQDGCLSLWRSLFLLRGVRMCVCVSVRAMIMMTSSCGGVVGCVGMWGVYASVRLHVCF